MASETLLPGDGSSADSVAGPLAIVMAPLGPAARTRILELLSGDLRDRVVLRLERRPTSEEVESSLSFVEQVLKSDVVRVFGEDEEEQDDLLQEATALQVADPIAVVLNHAEARQVAAILPSLPQQLQGDVLHRISATDWTALGKRLGRQEADFLKALDALLGSSGRRASPQFAAAVLRAVGNPQQIRYLLSAMYRLDPEATAVVQDLLYGFDALARLSDQELQSLLTGVDNWDLALAIRESPEGLRRRILGNVSDRRRIHLEEDEQALSDIDVEEALAFQRKIISRARRLYESGGLYTYLGSVASLDDDEDDDEERMQVVRGVRKTAPIAATGKATRGILAAVAGSAFAFLLIWLSGIQFSGRPSGSGRSLSLFGSASTAQTSSRRGGGIGGSEAGSSGASDFAMSEGNVVVVRADGEEIPPDLADLQPGDVVRTDPSGQAVFRMWADGGQVQVEASSSVQVGEEGDQTETPPQVRLRLGNVWIYANHPALEVFAPLASLTASQGSVYRLRIVLDATTTVSVHEGTVWLTPLIEADRRQVVAGAGESIQILPSGRIESGPWKNDGSWLGIL